MRRKAFEASRTKVKATEFKTRSMQAVEAKPVVDKGESDDAASLAAARELLFADRADAMREYQLAQRAQRENMERLRALRLAAQAR